jgi:hypothetical protein
MAILGTCPTCGTNAPLETYLLDRDAREALAALCQRLADHPEVVKRVPAYLALHSKPGRSAAWSKVARLIRELSDLVAAPVVAHNGQARANTPELWALAMEEAQDARTAGTLSVPLDGHGWLRVVAYTKAGQSEAKAAAARLAASRGETPIGYSPAHLGGPTPDRVSAADDLRELLGELAALKRLEAHDPGAHAERIAHLQSRLTALRGGTTPTPTETQQ